MRYVISVVSVRGTQIRNDLWSGEGPLDGAVAEATFKAKDEGWEILSVCNVEIPACTPQKSTSKRKRRKACG